MFSRIYKYNHQLSSYDVLKFLAIITMIIDHVGVYFIGGEIGEYWRSIGRFAAPMFFFVSGLIPKYQIRLSILMYGVFITVSTFLLGYDFSVNILLVIAGTKLVLGHWDPSRQKVAVLLLVFFLINFFSYFLIDVIEYGLYGFAYAFCGRLIAVKAHAKLVPFLLASTLACQFYERMFGYGKYVAIESLLVAIILFIMMLSFRKKVFQGNFLLKNGMLLFSRYSLEIYFWHLLLFEAFYQFYLLYSSSVH